MRIGEKLNAKISIGTPKEIVAYRLLNQFDPVDIDLVVIKDPDVISTSQIVKDVMNRATNSRTICFTTTHPVQSSIENIQVDEYIRIGQSHELAPNVEHLFVECINFAAKVSKLRKLLHSVECQIIVFCQVIKY